MMRAFFRGLIRIYQLVFSPIRGLLGRVSPNQCLYTPSCSEYADLAIQKYGVIKGSLKTCGRLLRCGPWGKGGKDLP